MVIRDNPTAAESRAILAEIIRAGARRIVPGRTGSDHRCYPIGPGQVVDALAPGEAERIAYHLIADAQAPEWDAVPGQDHVREVVRHIRKLEENPNG